MSSSMGSQMFVFWLIILQCWGCDPFTVFLFCDFFFLFFLFWPYVLASPNNFALGQSNCRSFVWSRRMTRGLRDIYKLKAPPFYFCLNYFLLYSHFPSGKGQAVPHYSPLFSFSPFCLDTAMRMNYLAGHASRNMVSLRGWPAMSWEFSSFGWGYECFFPFGEK